MIDTSPIATSPAATPTTAQSALRWIGYIGVAIFVWCFMAGSFDQLDVGVVHLLFAVFFCCALLVALPEALPVRLMMPVALGGGLVGTAMIWGISQTIHGEFARYTQVMVPALIALMARIIANRWIQSHPPLAHKDDETRSR